MIAWTLTSASSSGVPALPAKTLNATEPFMFAAAPFTSGVPIVRFGEDNAGGLHDGDSRAGPCTRLGDVHSLNAGTSGTLCGPAPFGRA